MFPITRVRPAMRLPSCVVAIAIVARAVRRQVGRRDDLEARGGEAEDGREGAGADALDAHRAQVVARDELAWQALEDECLQLREPVGQRHDRTAHAERLAYESRHVLERIGARAAELVRLPERARVFERGDVAARDVLDPDRLRTRPGTRSGNDRKEPGELREEIREAVVLAEDYRRTEDGVAQVGGRTGH